MVIFLYDKVIVGEQSSVAQKASPSAVTAFPVQVESTIEIVETKAKIMTKPEGTLVTASYYGGEEHGDFHGKVMANGERFNKYDASIVASNDLPLGTEIKVTNVENGKSLVMTVKDRGGFEKYGRKLDVSREAAKKLGFKEQGLALVRYIVVRKPYRA